MNIGKATVGSVNHHNDAGSTCPSEGFLARLEAVKYLLLKLAAGPTYLSIKA